MNNRIKNSKPKVSSEEQAKKIINKYIYTMRQVMNVQNKEKFNFLIQEHFELPIYACKFEIISEVVDKPLKIKLIETENAVESSKSIKVLSRKQKLYFSNNIYKRKLENEIEILGIDENDNSILIVNKIPEKKSTLYSSQDVKPKFKISPLNRFFKSPSDADYEWFSNFIIQNHDGRDIELVKSGRTIERLKINSIWKLNDREALISFRKQSNKISIGHCLTIGPDSLNIMRQKNAFEKLMNHKRDHNDNLHRLFGFEEFKRLNDNVEEDEIEWLILNDENWEGTLEQRRFVVNSLNTNDYSILHGPPGSGKTTAIMELIYQLQKRDEGVKIGIIASTHVAVDNILEKLKEYKKLQSTVLAARIGRENVVSERVYEFMYDNLKDNIVNQLKNSFETYKQNKTLTKGQEIIEKMLTSENIKPMESEIIDHVNLTCATPIGMLRHPVFNEGTINLSISGAFNKKNQNIKIFDYLIIDEASKMTLQEFMVSAILSDKFIIVGDLKQLTPYTEQRDLEIALETTINNYYVKEETENNNEKSNNMLVKNTFKTSEKIVFKNYLFHLHKNNSLKRVINSTEIMFVNGNEITNVFKKWIEELSINNEFYLLIIRNKIEFNEQMNNICKANLVVIDNDLRKSVTEFLPMNFTSRNEFNEIGYIDDDNFKNTWEEEVSWRITSQYVGGNKILDNALEKLIPKEISDEKWRKDFDINFVKLFSLPSILSMLVGETKIHGIYNKVNLINGLRDSSKEVLLVYQNRMHTEIANVSREIFYDNKALMTSQKVKEIKEMWAYRIKTFHREKTILSKMNFIRTIPTKSIIEQFKLESELSIELIQSLLSQINDNYNQEKPIKIAILTYYLKHGKFVENELLKKFKYTDGRGIKDLHTSIKRYMINNRTILEIETKTVDKYQGQEADIVILLFGNIRYTHFFDNPHRLNVAITRAKYQNILIASSEIIDKSEKRDKNIWKVYENHNTKNIVVQKINKNKEGKKE